MNDQDKRTIVNDEHVANKAVRVLSERRSLPVQCRIKYELAYVLLAYNIITKLLSTSSVLDRAFYTRLMQHQNDEFRTKRRERII